MRIIELFPLRLTVGFDRERNVLWNRKLTCLTHYHLIQRARMNDDELHFTENLLPLYYVSYDQIV